MRTETQEEFLLSIALSDALSSSVQHVKTYENGTSDDRKKFRAAFKNWLTSPTLIARYQKEVCDEEHKDTITAFAEYLSHNLAPILAKANSRKVPIAVAQKAVNLYLKFLWCLGLIERPPHCPIDASVLEEIGDKKTRWTKLHGIDDYTCVIEAIRKYCKEHKGGQSLAEWECELWNRKRAGRPPASSASARPMNLRLKRHDIDPPRCRAAR